MCWGRTYVITTASHTLAPHALHAAPPVCIQECRRQSMQCIALLRCVLQGVLQVFCQPSASDSEWCRQLSCAHHPPSWLHCQGAAVVEPRTPFPCCTPACMQCWCHRCIQQSYCKLRRACVDLNHPLRVIPSSLLSFGQQLTTVSRSAASASMLPALGVRCNIMWQTPCLHAHVVKHNARPTAAVQHEAPEL